MSSPTQVSPIRRDIPTRTNYNLNAWHISGINAQIVRGICRVAGTTLTKYKDPDSQGLIKRLLTELVDSHPEWALEHMNGTFKVLLTKELKELPAGKVAPFAFIALQWSILLLGGIPTDEEKRAKLTPEIEQMLGFQCQFYQMALFVGNAKVTRKTNDILFEFWAETALDQVAAKWLLTRELEMGGLLYVAGIVQCQEETDGHSALVEEQKDLLLDQFIRFFVTAKEKANPHYLAQCRVLINSISEADFQSKFLPPMQKALLRNPEIVLKVAGIIFDAVEIDLSACAFDLGKVLIQNLYSNNADSRTEALDSLRSLAEKCEEAGVIDRLVELIFSVWNNGVDGKKLTLIELRLSVLRGIGALSGSCALPEHLQGSVKLVCENFFKVLSTETAEKLIVQSLDVFSLWSENLIGELPERFITVFNAGLTGKSATQLTRIAYLEWLFCCLSNTKIGPSDISKLLPTLIKCAEKLTKEQKEQLPATAINEALVASCLTIRLLEIAEGRPGVEEELVKSFWSIVLDMNKQVFQQDKFLATVSPNGLKFVMFLSEKLLCAHYDRLKGDPQCLFRAVVVCLHAGDVNVRSYCLSLLRKLTAVKGQEVQFIGHLLAELRVFLKSANLINSENVEAGEIPVSAVVDALNGICAMEGERQLLF